MSTSIYVNGCTTCGINANYIIRVRHSIPDVTVCNTRRNDEALKQHMEYLERAGMDKGQYHAIVVENEGERITLLKEWKS